MKRIYQTHQRKQLMNFLSLHKDSQFSIEEIIEQFKGEEVPAPSSIYRLMKQLVEEGLVKRYAKDGSRQFMYQLIDGEDCDHHFHLKCMSCGKLIHLSDEASEEMRHMVSEEVNFDISQDKTILFGECTACKKQPVKNKRVEERSVHHESHH